MHLIGCLVVLLLGGLARAGDLRLRADALDTLYELNLSPDQLRALEKIATTTAAKPVPEPKLGQKLRNALNDYCAALVKGDDEKISELADKVDQLEEKSDLDDPEVTTTDAAKKKSADAMALLTAGQLASFIAMHSDEVVGPGELVIESMDEARSDPDADYKDLRADVVEQVSQLVHGFGPDTDKAGEKAGVFLDRVRKLSDADLKAKRHDLEGEAKHIAGNIDAFVTLKHWTESELADLLSNPELPGAISAMEAHATAAAKEGAKEGKQ
jgi:hypothetical protein